MLTPVFHPNFDDSMVCIGDFWAASEGLDRLVIRIGRMISYQEYNTKSPLNGLAAKWAAQNSNLLPIDPRPVAPPLIDASHVQAQQAAEAPAVAQPVAEVHAPVDEPWLERIVIPAGNPTIPAPDELKIEAAAGTDRADFGRWWKVILISAVLATLGGVLVWYVFHRQGKVAVGSAVDPSRRIRATAARRSSSF